MVVIRLGNLQVKGAPEKILAESARFYNDHGEQVTLLRRSSSMLLRMCLQVSTFSNGQVPLQNVHALMVELNKHSGLCGFVFSVFGEHFVRRKWITFDRGCNIARSASKNC